VETRGISQHAVEIEDTGIEIAPTYRE